MADIPLPKSFGDALMQGAETGTNIFQKLIQPYMQATELAQRQKQFDATQGLNREKFEYEKYMQSPQSLIDRIKSLQSMGSNVSSPDVSGRGPLTNVPSYMQSLTGGQSVAPEEASPNNIDINNIIRGAIKQYSGIDPYTETPDVKRQKDLKLEGDKLKLKDKIIAEKDISHLKTGIKSLQRLLNVAHTNPDIFGKPYVYGKAYPKFTSQSRFGDWQADIGNVLSDMGRKLGDRGGQAVADLASEFKASHTEQQPVALGKLYTSLQQAVDLVNEKREVAGLEPLEMFDIVEMPKLESIPKNQLKYIPTKILTEMYHREKERLGN